MIFDVLKTAHKPLTYYQARRVTDKQRELMTRYLTAPFGSREAAGLAEAVQILDCFIRWQADVL